MHILVLSEPLGAITRSIAGDLADVQVLPYPLTGTGDRMRAEHLMDQAHVLIVPRAGDVSTLPRREEMRLITLDDVLPASFQYPVLINNRQFFTYAAKDLQDQVIVAIRDRLVDMDVVRAGKYEVAAKHLRDLLKEKGSLIDTY